MNCDHVFDMLTRGPFPSGDPQDESVELHLQACHECRQLAEALQPAVDLFREVIGPEEGSGLPGYRGALLRGNAVCLNGSPAGSLIGRVIARNEPPRPSRSPSVRGWRVSRTSCSWAAAVALLCGVAVLIGQGWEHRRIALAAAGQPLAGQPGAEAGAESPRSGPSLTLDHVQIASLERLELPELCIPTGLAGRAEYHCCTRCHSAAQPQRRRLASVAAMLAACTVCHRAS